jgi:hypothetical protein
LDTGRESHHRDVLLPLSTSPEHNAALPWLNEAAQSAGAVNQVPPISTEPEVLPWVIAIVVIILSVSLVAGGTYYGLGL